MEVESGDLKKAALLRFFQAEMRRFKRVAECDNGVCVGSIMDFVSLCSKEGAQGFRIYHRPGLRVNCVPSALANCYFDRLNELWRSVADCRYCAPEVRLFINACKCVELPLYPLINPRFQSHPTWIDAERFNIVVDCIKESSRSKKYKKSLEQRRYRRAARFLSLVEYVDSLFENRSRFIVIRLDLSYSREALSRMNSEQSKLDIRKFLNNTRGNGRLFADLEGYVWKFEQSGKGGDHFHFLMFFNNRRWLNSSRLADLIGRYWETVITGGRGRYFNGNRKGYLNALKNVGVGVVNADDCVKRFNLLSVLAYFCKDQQSILIADSRRPTVFGQGRRKVGRGARARRRKLAPGNGHYIFSKPF